MINIKPKDVLKVICNNYNIHLIPLNNFPQGINAIDLLDAKIDRVTNRNKLWLITQFINEIDNKRFILETVKEYKKINNVKLPKYISNYIQILEDYVSGKLEKNAFFGYKNDAFKDAKKMKTLEKRFIALNTAKAFDPDNPCSIVSRGTYKIQKEVLKKILENY